MVTTILGKLFYNMFKDKENIIYGGIKIMLRDIIIIDEDKCDGCGICIDACHEGALKIIDGKAKLISESYCDGFGDCLPNCPTDAITIEKREVAAYDEEAVAKNIARRNTQNSVQPAGCPGTMAKMIKHEENPATSNHDSPQMTSQLGQWPCQIKLVNPTAPYFNDAHLLIAADCTAFAYANIHNDYMKGKITIIGCPKLDNIDYSEKLTDILTNNNIKSVQVLKMQVPCCTGIAHATVKALQDCKKMIPWSVTTMSVTGEIIED